MLGYNCLRGRSTSRLDALVFEVGFYNGKRLESNDIDIAMSAL